MPLASIARAAEPVRAKPNVQAVRANVDPLDQQRYYARLLGREKFVPQRIELLNGRARVG